MSLPWLNVANTKRVGLVSKKFEVLVIGGGPAGSTAASLLARAGMSVKLLERAVFPRYHIGESITTSCRGILDYLGALEKVNSRGYTSKSGALLRWGKEDDWVIDWTQQFGPDMRSWQVERADFDHVLLEHAKESGVDVVEGARVKKVLFEGDRAIGAEWVAPETGEIVTTHADFVLDASGRAGLIGAQHLDNRQPHEIFRNVAIWGYWDGGELLPNSPKGGINVVSSDDGWYWVIPLSGDRFSVGFVTHKTNFGERRKEFGSIEDMLLAMIAESPTVKGLVASGTFQGKARVEQDFSYVADRFCGDGYFLMGDAACFLDPLLSTGVHLAMYSGLLTAASISGMAHGDVTPTEAQSFYETLFRNAYVRLFTLVSGFYQKHAGKDRYFALANSLARDETVSEETADVAFGEIISGGTDLREAADISGKASESIDQVIVEQKQQKSPVRELLDAAAEAQERARLAAGQQERLTPDTAIDTNDLYDVGNGFYLLMEPRLGVGKVNADA
ncbi:NAD(P)/FAD-dependent oxidoreductase [Streptomyces sp. NPDC001552]|uniref:NAD(P)/FAD-dependent oxidoreductase n=1 Tax=Streptomyces sp. NPDC001552 TaxID=3364587 RepID=UPI0036772F6F